MGPEVDQLIFGLLLQRRCLIDRFSYPVVGLPVGQPVPPATGKPATG